MGRSPQPRDSQRIHGTGRRPRGQPGRPGSGNGPGTRAGARQAGRAMSGRGAKRSRLSVRYFDDRILLTETHAWAYFRVPTISYEFMTGQQREALATNLTVALAGIRMADAEVHLRIAHRSYPAAQWATGLHATSDGGPGWLPYLDEMYRQVWAKDFWTKEVYIGVRLGQRGVRAQLTGGVLAHFATAYRTGEQALGIEDAAIGVPEIARWTEQA